MISSLLYYKNIKFIGAFLNRSESNKYRTKLLVARFCKLNFPLRKDTHYFVFKRVICSLC